MNINAVEVADVSFKYHKTNVLQNIYASVPKGQIYALLGPSGSGKTTLLRLILGRIKPSSGSITVFGSNKLGHFNRIIGYMPQSQALCPELTINETMNYFASLYQLEQAKFESQKRILRDVLCLPDEGQIVATLSGGQQKALSLALVFLHSPKLVILDEPTVGTDPMLGDQIWSYLRTNCNQGLTVILVTHYILEASMAHHVGMMRSGRLIEEGTPQSLYVKYKENNLETIFIKICTDKKILKEISQRAQSYHKNIVNFLSYDTNQDLVGNYQKKNSAQIELDQSQIAPSSNYSLMWLLFILIRRNLQKVINSKLTTVMLFSPIFCTLLMCITFKVDKILLPTAVFNEDLNPVYSSQMLAITKGFQVHQVAYTHHKTLENAIAAVQMGHAIAAIWFDKNFSSAIDVRAMASIIKKNRQTDQESTSNTEKTTETESGEATMNESRTASSNLDATETSLPDEMLFSKYTTEVATIESTTLSDVTTGPNTEMSLIESSDNAIKVNSTRNKREADEEEEEEEEEDEYEGSNFVRITNVTMRQSNIRVFVDNSNMFFSQPLMDMFNFGSWELMNKIVQDHGEVTLASPVVVKEIVYAEGTETPDFLLSGYMIAFLYLSQVTLASQLLIQERNDGFFDRAIVAGAKHSLMFFSHFITNFLFSFIQIGLMFLIGFTWYSIPNFGSYWLAFILILIQSASSIMTGLLISAICKENFSAFFIALSITLSQLFTSGAVFPIISFDPLINFILNITPISMPVESLRNVMLRGWDLSNFRVAHGFVTNIITTFAFGVIALYFFIRRS